MTAHASGQALLPRARRAFARTLLAGDARPDVIDAALGLRTTDIARRVRMYGGVGDWRGMDDGGLAQTRPADCLVVAEALPTGAHLVDLGSGLGRFALVLALVRPDITVTGLEIDPVRVSAARRAAEGLGLRDRVRFAVADLAEAPLPVADAWYAFLPFPAETAARVLGAIRGEGRPGHLFLQGEWPELRLDEADWLTRSPTPPPLRHWRMHP